MATRMQNTWCIFLSCYLLNACQVCRSTSSFKWPFFVHFLLPYLIPSLQNPAIVAVLLPFPSAVASIQSLIGVIKIHQSPMAWDLPTGNVAYSCRKDCAGFIHLCLLCSTCIQIPWEIMSVWSTLPKALTEAGIHPLWTVYSGTRGLRCGFSWLGNNAFAQVCSLKAQNLRTSPPKKKYLYISMSSGGFTRLPRPKQFS